MILLNSALKSLEVILGGAVTTTELPWTAHWVDIDQTTFAATAAAEADGTTNGGNAVTMVAAPSAGITRQVKFVTVYEADTVAPTVTIRINDNGVFRIVTKVTLALGDNLIMRD